MIDDEFLQIDGDGHQPSNIPSRMGLFVYSSKLFLYTRVILLRPLLLLSAQSNLRPEATAPNLWNIAALDRELAGYACNLCVKSAQELIENLHHNIETPYRISPWHTVYLSFAAAVVLIAAQRCPIIDPLAKKEAFDLSLGYCVAILAHHEPQIHSACEAIRVLQKLRNQMKNFQTQNAIDYGTNRESLNNSSSATDVPPETGIEHFAEPSQDWWNEFIPNGTEINSETWYSQHLINLDWLDIS
ncbi:hypothetical protein BKA61DRAFT_654783 [Leptodontidium sp. MPI-SDFR-AT-0119]|nr:hypothetical protein BKA61DRAFT_654783 [Leptodontidium sp. MPI-SDFR-AT-0119]